MTDKLLTNTATIVSAFVGRNQVVATDIPALIQTVFGAMSGLGPAPAAPPTPEVLSPAVPVRRSVTDDYIICLEDGVKLRMLKRYIRTHFGLTPDEYRAKWKLPASYPMVAPAYAQKRSELAKAIGLGRKPDTPRGRRKRAS